MVKDALSPVINPLIAYLYRTPATAELLKPFIGKGTPLSTFLDQTGKPIVDALSGFLSDNPLASAAAKQIADDPNVEGVFAAIKGVTDAIGPMETALLRGLTYLGAIAKGESADKAAETANSAVSNLQGLSEGASSGKRHLLQNALADMLPSQTPNPDLPNPSNNPALAGLERIIEQDPFDQALVAALSPVLDPLATYISRTPALSDALATLIGQNTPVVQAVTDVATPIVQGFEERVLTNPVAINALQAVTDTPLVDGALQIVANATDVLAPFLRTATRVGTYLGALARGSPAEQALQVANSVFGNDSPSGRRHLLQASHPAANTVQSQAATLRQLADFLPSQTPNPQLPTPDNNPALAGLFSIIPNDPIDQRLSGALTPILDPVLTYIYRTPAISDTIAKLLSNDSPLVQKITLEALPLIAAYNTTVVNTPVGQSALESAANSPLLTAIFAELQRLSSQTAPVAQTLLNVGTNLGTLANGLPAQQALDLAANLPSVSTNGRRLQQMQASPGQTAGQTTGQTIGQTVGQTTGQTAGQTTGQIAGQNTGQTIGQITGQTAGQTAEQTIGQTAGQSIGQTTGQSIGQSTVREALLLLSEIMSSAPRSAPTGGDPASATAGAPMPNLAAQSPSGSFSAAALAPGPAANLLQELAALEQAITGLPQAASLIGSAVNTVVADAQSALADTGRAIAQGNFTEALNITIAAAQDLEKVFNETVTQVGANVSIVLPAINGSFSVMQPEQITALLAAGEGGQNNQLVEDISGLLNIILSDAAKLAESVPDPVAYLEKQLTFGFSTPLDKLVYKLKNATVPATLSDAQDEVKDILSAFCTPPSFTPSTSTLAACVAETIELQLVPWSCSFDDSNKTLKGDGTTAVTCMPAYLQLVKTPASCNMAYTAACEWDGRECKLETTLFGVDSSATYGGTPILKDVKELISNVVSNVTVALTSEIKQLNASALFGATMRDLGASFNAAVNFTSAPTVSANLAGAGSIVADLSTAGSLASGAWGVMQQLGSIFG
ncbi:hypothetical protein COCOBI_15-0920 [Coccomyxa sp. Obi]|nr:hypothetical protein COCOBI_15-0920 [Coccomyxa sp. Obi]